MPPMYLAVVLIVSAFLPPSLAQYGPPAVKGKKHRTTTTTPLPPDIQGINLGQAYPGYNTISSTPLPDNSLGSYNPPPQDGGSYWWQNPNSPFSGATAPAPGPSPAPQPQPGHPGGCGAGGASGCGGAPQQPVNIQGNPFLSGLKPGGGAVPPIQPTGQTITCSGPGNVCVLKDQCSNGVVNSNGRGLFDVRSEVQYCNAASEACCRLPSQGSRPSGDCGGYGSGEGCWPTPLHPSPYPGQPAPQPSPYPGQPAPQPSPYPGQQPNGGSQNAGPGLVHIPPSPAGPSYPSNGPQYPSASIPAPTYSPPGSNSYGQPGTNGIPIGGSIYDGAGRPPVTQAPQQRYTGPQNTTPHPGCAAALKCVPENYCTAEGVMANSPVTLTREQYENRVPMSDCADPVTGAIGKCCRDPNYKDPWPGGMMMMKGGNGGGGQLPQQQFPPQQPQNDCGPTASCQHPYQCANHLRVQPTKNCRVPHDGASGVCCSNNQLPFPSGQPGGAVFPGSTPAQQKPHKKPIPGYPQPKPSAQPFPQPTPQQPFPQTSPSHQPFPQTIPSQQPFPQKPNTQPFPQNLPSSPYPQPKPSASPYPQPKPSRQPFPQPTPSNQQFPQTSPSQQPHPQTAPSNQPFPQTIPSQQSYPQTRPSQPSFPQTSPQSYPQTRPSQPSLPNTNPSQQPHPQTSPSQQPHLQTSPSQQPHHQTNPSQQPHHQTSPSQQPFPQTNPSQQPYPQKPSNQPFPQNLPSSPYPQPNPSPSPQPFPQPKPSIQPFPSQQPQAFPTAQPSQPIPSAQPSPYPRPGRPVPSIQPQPSSPNFPGSQQLPGQVSPTPGAECGIRRQVSRQGLADTDAGFSEFPWQALVVSSSDQKPLCSAVIISDRAVITAAHCLQNLESNDIAVKAGVWKLNSNNAPKPSQTSHVAAISRHPKFDAGSLFNDLAILVLSQPLKFDEHIDKICLPPKGQDISQQRGICTATGWGKPAIQGNVPGSILHQIPVQLIPHNTCEEKLRQTNLGRYFILNPSFQCAVPAGPSQDLCKVDAGGPIACDRGDGHLMLSGLYSWDVGCSVPNSPTVFGGMDTEWIEKILARPVDDLVRDELNDILKQQQQEELGGVDIDNKPGFSQGYGKK